MVDHQHHTESAYVGNAKMIDDRTHHQKFRDFERLFGDRLTRTNVYMEILSIVAHGVERPKDLPSA